MNLAWECGEDSLSLWVLTGGGCGRNVGEVGGPRPCLPGTAQWGSQPEAPEKVTGPWRAWKQIRRIPHLSFAYTIADQSTCFQIIPYFTSAWRTGPAGVRN